MKDYTLTLTARRLKFEICSYLVCLLIAFALNIYAIIAYDGKWTELITTFFYYVIFSIALYVAWALIRLIIFGVKALIKR